MRLKLVANFKAKEYNKMSKIEKIIERLKTAPRDFTYEELKKVLNNYGYIEYNKGKTSGAKVAFIKEENKKISIHKPHPSNILKPYQINEIIKKLKEMEDF